ncbi:putative zinc finger protein At1g68190 isoform X3 [Primulina tabacum]|uniref:putative zinc finger protein At1g68190 isoform X3 n=1 Tax=Primulina tabacum TaxID=48773 RepID=UPI003F5A1B21
MEKVCEFCKSLRPIVYCKADSAHLCLSCDAKVHSANALSYRHPRTLVCESCRNRAARVRCVDHQMFMCHSCDSGSHRVSSRHRKRVIRSYVGCPSAKDLAVLWGFDLNQLESKLGDKDDQSVYSSSISVDSGVVATSNARKVPFEEGSNIRGKMVLKDEIRQQTTCSILQQIVDLERKLAKGSDDSRLVHVKDRTDGLSFEYDGNRKVHKTLGNHAEDHLGVHTNNQNMANLDEETTEEPFLMSFSQLDQLTSTESPIHGESFWQCKTDAHNSEIWLQNMQDLGVCDEMRCFDDVNIPDVDLTFRNFEEIFGNDQQEIAGTQVGAKCTDCYISKEHSATSKFNSSCASTTKVRIGFPEIEYFWALPVFFPTLFCYSRMHQGLLPLHTLCSNPMMSPQILIFLTKFIAIQRVNIVSIQLNYLTQHRSLSQERLVKALILKARTMK